jgi:hypothetical protein
VRRVWRAIRSYQVPDQNTQPFNFSGTHTVIIAQEDYLIIVDE